MVDGVRQEHENPLRLVMIARTHGIQYVTLAP